MSKVLFIVSNIFFPHRIALSYSVTKNVVWVVQRLKPGLCGDNPAVKCPRHELWTGYRVGRSEFKQGYKKYGVFGHRAFVANSGEGGG